MAEEKEKNNKHSLGHEIGLGVTVVRALLLLVLGMSLLFIPDKTHKMLFNAMGLFWLTTGIVLVRREAHAKGNRLLLAVAILGVASGVLVLTRGISTPVGGGEVGQESAGCGHSADRRTARDDPVEIGQAGPTRPADRQHIAGFRRDRLGRAAYL